MNRRHMLAAGIAATALVVAGCNANPRTPATGQTATASGATTTTPARGGTLKVLSTSKEIHFDPAMSQNLGTSGIHYIVRGLTSWKTDPKAMAELAPDLATDTGTTSDGGRTWKFTLKDDLRYADGSPIVAADIKFGVERSFDEQLQGGLGYHKQLLVGAPGYRGPAQGQHLDSIETPDDKTIIFHLDRPFADWPWITSMPAFAPVPATKGMGIPAYDHTPPASGPYRVTDYKVGSKVVLERNPHWKAETDPVRPAYPDRIEYEMGLNSETAGQRMAADQGDDKNATGPSVNASLITRINADPKLKERVYVSPSGQMTFLVMNTSRPGLSDIKVRRAIQYAINKQQIQTIAGGPVYGGDIATTLLPPGVYGHEKFDLYPAAPTGDQAKAKEVLAGAQVPKLTLAIDSAKTAQGNQAASIANDLKAIGIEVQIVPQDADKLSDTQTKTGDFDLTLAGWQADFPSAYAALQPLIASSEIGNGGYNMARLSDPKIDQAIAEASGVLDAAAAQKKWAEIDRAAMELAPVVPLIYSKNAFIYGSNVGGSYVPLYPSYTNALVQGLKKP
ncbi:ABC transporter substrate-binding protein [Mariniluteicoccus endophyticus]